MTSTCRRCASSLESNVVSYFEVYPLQCPFLFAASDILLSHVITFLNDKDDWRIRAAVFDCIAPIATHVGWPSIMTILKPLIQQVHLKNVRKHTKSLQGLRDVNESVVHSTLLLLAKVRPVQLAHKVTLYELLADALPYMAHPSCELRSATVACVSQLHYTLNIADIHYKILPMLKPFVCSVDAHVGTTLDYQVERTSALIKDNEVLPVGPTSCSSTADTSRSLVDLHQLGTHSRPYRLSTHPRNAQVSFLTRNSLLKLLQPSISPQSTR